MDQSSVSRAFIREITAGQDLDIGAVAGSVAEVERLLLLGRVKSYNFV